MKNFLLSIPIGILYFACFILTTVGIVFLIAIDELEYLKGVEDGE